MSIRAYIHTYVNVYLACVEVIRETTKNRMNMRSLSIALASVVVVAVINVVGVIVIK